nr:MAG TPA: hypothetical protein [Caudoviricetes sp.]
MQLTEIKKHGVNCGKVEKNICKTLDKSLLV